MLQFTAYSLPPLAATLVALLAYRRLRLRSDVPGVNGLMLLLASVMFWSLAELVGSVLTDLGTKKAAAQLAYLGIVMAPIGWFVFALAYARRELRIPRALMNTVCIVPLTTLVLVATNDWHQFIWTNAFLITDHGYVGLVTTHGAWFYVHAVYAYVLMLAASAILAYVVSISQNNWRPVAAVLAAPAMVTCANLFYLSPFNPSPWFDVTTLGFAVAAVILDRGLLRFGLLDNIPVVRDRVVEQLADPVIVVNHRGVVVDANLAAEDMLEATRHQIKGSDLLHLLPAWPRDEIDAKVRREGHSTIEVNMDSKAFDVAVSLLNASSRRSDLVLVFRDVTRRRDDEQSLRKMQKELQRLAHTDPLTGLYNRRFFMQRLQEEIERVARHGHQLSVLLFDLDHFKKVNDTHGHQVGDKVLIAIANLSNQVKRVADIAARLGGEEFALLLPDTDQQGAVHLAQRLRKVIADYDHKNANGGALFVTTSIGVATISQAGGVDTLLRTADEALYRAKSQGRNRVCSQTL